MLEPFCFTGWWGWEGPSVHKLRVCWQSLLGGVILMLVFNAISSSRILDCESLQEKVLEVLMKRSLNSWIFVAIFEFWQRTNWIPQEPKKTVLGQNLPLCLPPRAPEWHKNRLTCMIFMWYTPVGCLVVFWTFLELLEAQTGFLPVEGLIWALAVTQLEYTLRG